MPVEEVCRALGVTEEDLQAELDLLLMCGKPPFSPADLFEVYTEGDRVFVHLAQNLVRPPRLTHEEAMALALGARMLSGGGSAAWDALVERVMGKLEQAMTPAEVERYRRLSERIVLAPASAPPAEVQDALREALDARQRVRVHYYSKRSDAFGARVLRPYALLHHRGYGYLLAGEETGGEEVVQKLFRLDRIRDVEPLAPEGAYALPEGLEPSRVVPGANDAAAPPALVEVSAKRARWVAERFGDQVTITGDGRARVRFEGWSEAWISAWVLSFGGEAVVLEPESLRARVLEEARQARAAYAG